MRRGTTPTLTFTLPFDGDNITKLSIAFAQKLHNDKSSIIFTKVLSDVEIDDYDVSVTLSEDETLKLREDIPLEIQMRCAVGTSRLASNILKVDVRKIIQDGKLA